MRPWQFDFDLFIVIIGSFAAVILAALGTKLMMRNKYTPGWLVYLVTAGIALITFGLWVNWAASSLAAK